MKVEQDLSLMSQSFQWVDLSAAILSYWIQSLVQRGATELRTKAQRQKLRLRKARKQEGTEEKENYFFTIFPFDFSS